jgi:hypothetical protein
MSIPKIAISNEDDLSLRILESHLKTNINRNPSTSSSPYKSIIKTRTSQPQSPSSSTTTQSFHTCHESIRKDSLKVSLPLKRSYTISVVKNNSERRRQQYLENPLRRINSYQTSSRKPFIDNLISPIEMLNIYQTPKHEENSIRLIIDTDTNIINNQIDIQVDRTKNEHQSQTGVNIYLVGFFVN